jgi:exodeoxyribonuclease V beta subunit
MLNERLEPIRAAGGVAGLFAVEEVGPAEPPPDPAALAAVLAGWRPPAGLLVEAHLDREVARAMAERRGPVTSSYSRMKRSSPEEESEPEEAEPAAAAAGADAGPGGRHVGIFLHEVLENIPLAAAVEAADPEAFAAEPRVASALRTAALRRDLDPDDPRWARMIFGALHHPIDFGGGLVVPGVARASRHLREVDFSLPLCDADGHERAILRGAIDLVFEHEGRIFWLDWKSDRLPDYQPATLAAHVAREYAIQSDVYSLALARMLALHRAGRERFGGLVYLFLRGVAAHTERPGPHELAVREAALLARAPDRGAP